MQLRFALVAETSLVRVEDLYRLGRALELNAQHCAEAWGVSAPTVDVVDGTKRLPGDYHPLRFRSHSDEDPGAAGVNYWDPISKGPAGIIYADRCSGLNEGDTSLSEVASHELLEAFVNPTKRVWLKHPVRPVDVAGEVCDLLQDTYEIEAAGTRWKVANFVTPAWFGLGMKPPTRFDYAWSLKAAGQIGPEGYGIFREHLEIGQRRWAEDCTGAAFGAVPIKHAAQAVRALSPSSRAAQLMRAP